MLWLAVAFGGAIGAMARYAAASAFPVTSGQFPYATLGVNIVGSLLAGMLYVLIVEKGLLSPQWKPFLMVGMLGALTTFSTFSLESVLLFREGSIYLAVAYMLSSLISCVLAAFIGLSLTTRII
jgi:CrcB protein